MLFSSRETLRRKDFSQCTADEIAEARRIIEGFTWRLSSKTRRRTRQARQVHRSSRHPPWLAAPRRHPARATPPETKDPHPPPRRHLRHLRLDGPLRPAAVALRARSGKGLENTEVFVFGTRLTRITRELRRRDVDTALTQVVGSVEDWSGGTRIGEAIKAFNYQWARRVLRSGRRW